MSVFAQPKQLLRRNSDRLVGLVDQGLLAVSRVCALLIFARILTKDDFGTFALMVSISFLLNNLQRSLAILPFIVSCPTVEDVRKHGNQWLWIDLILAALVASLLALAAGITALVGGPGWVVRALAFSALGAPALMMYAFSRRWFYQARVYRRVVVMAVAHFVAYGLGIAATYATAPNPTFALLSFAFAPAVAVTIAYSGGLRLKDWPTRAILNAWNKTRSFSAWSFFGFLVRAIYNNGMNIIIAGFVGPVGSAAFTATRTFVAPVVTLATAVDVIDKPRAGRAYAKRGMKGLKKSIRNTLFMLLGLGAPYLTLVAVFSEPILTFFYADKYADLSFELRLWVTAMLLHIVAEPTATMLVTLRNTRAIFFCGLAGSIVALIIVTLTLVVPILPIHGVAAALAAMCAGRFVNFLLLLLAASSRTPFKSPPVPTIPQDEADDGKKTERN